VLQCGDDNKVLFQFTAAAVDDRKAQIDLGFDGVTLRQAAPVMTGCDETLRRK